VDRLEPFGAPGDAHRTVGFHTAILPSPVRNARLSASPIQNEDARLL
jgi:hypothetical protein